MEGLGTKRCMDKRCNTKSSQTCERVLVKCQAQMESRFKKTYAQNGHIARWDQKM
jgi:hypothetical protein